MPSDPRSLRDVTYAEPGEYAVTAVAIGAGCSYSNTATIRRVLTVGIEVTPLESTPP